MTDRFIDNFTPGSGGDGLSWANAELTAAAVDAADTAGDRWLFDSRHSESTAGAVTLNVAGTKATPSQLLSVTQSGASGVSALTSGAIVATSGGNGITLRGTFYAYGIKFNNGTTGVSTNLTLNDTDTHHQIYDTCTFSLVSSASSNQVVVGTSSSATEGSLVFLNCTFKFSATGQGLNCRQQNVTFRGGSIDGTGSAITTFVSGVSLGGLSLLVDGFDFSNAATGVVLIAASQEGVGKAVFRNCKMPSTWSGTLLGGAPGNLGFRAEMWNCSASDTQYQMWIEDYAGSIKHETTIVHTGGASDGTTPISWKMASSANAEYPTIILRSPEIFVPNTTTGSSKTLTVEIAQDGTTTALNDDEIWLEVEYLGTSGTPLALFANDAKASVIATAAAQANSSESWGGLSGTNKKQALAVTFTPQEEGVYIARVCLAKASTTVYVDPKVTVS